ncbi:hypothetical protein AB8Q18_00765 [Neisseriaceae bacterium CLB008]|nr:hypothetical protein [Neisseriaceae bacterium]
MKHLKKITFLIGLVYWLAVCAWQGRGLVLNAAELAQPLGFQQGFEASIRQGFASFSQGFMTLLNLLLPVWAVYVSRHRRWVMALVLLPLTVAAVAAVASLVWTLPMTENEILAVVLNAWTLWFLFAAYCAVVGLLSVLLPPKHVVVELNSNVLLDEDAAEQGK